MTFLRTLGQIIALVVLASVAIAIFNTLRAEYILVCTGNKVIPTHVIFRSNFEGEQ